jgi:hypothetical protein
VLTRADLPRDNRAQLYKAVVNSETTTRQLIFSFPTATGAEPRTVMEEVSAEVSDAKWLRTQVTLIAVRAPTSPQYQINFICDPLPQG